MWAYVHASLFFCFFYHTSLRLRIVLLRSMIIQHCIAIGLLHSAILEKNSKTALIIVQIDLFGQIVLIDLYSGWR